MKPRYWVAGVLALALQLALQACGPVPLRELTAEEKQSDLQWVYSIFNENYAPLEYKESLYGFKFETLKNQYLQKAAQTKDNAEYYDLLYRFVAEFKDAHTSGSLQNPSLPGRAQIAYLGFTGTRKGSALLVRDFLPTMQSDKLPIVKGDLITKLNGIPLVDYIQSKLLKFRDLGNKESNLTYHMGKIFVRVSTQNGQPEGTDAVLTIKRGDSEFDITLPWIVRDLYQFKQEQAQAPKPSPSPSPSESSATESLADVLQLTDDAGNVIAKIGFLGFDGLPTQTLKMRQKITRLAGFHFFNGFRFMDAYDRFINISLDSSETQSQTPEQLLKAERYVPAKAVLLPNAKTFPAYVVRAKGTGTEATELVGVIYLNAFEAPSEADAVKEFKTTLASFEELGVKGIVIDMINNGGGSLTLGMQLAQALTAKKIEMPQLQMRLSDNWIEEFQTESLTGKSDTERELARRVMVNLIEDRNLGQRLSKPMSVESLAPFISKPNTTLKSNFKIVLAVNEMCASMCDIFAGILKDNQLTKAIIGSNTMGAGGNVVEYYQAPNSHFGVRQTESLMLRKNGTYVENRGIAVDIEMPVNESADTKYSDVVKKALETAATP